VLFILPNLQVGGAEKITLNIIRALDKNKFQPILFLLKDEGEFRGHVPTEIQVITALRTNQKILLNLPLVLKKLIKAAKGVNLLIGGLELTPTYFAIIVSKLLKIPVLGWVHTNLNSYPPASNLKHALLLKFLYPKLNSVIAVSTNTGNDILNLIPSLKNKIKVIYNPYFENIEPRNPEDSTQLISRKPYILSVGRLVPEKGFDFLIKAHHEMLQKGINHQLVILGEGPERKALEKIVEGLNLKDSVTLAGYQSNPGLWMKHAEVFVISSRVEGFPLVAVEALAAGLPIVSFACPGGLSELFQDGKFGVLVPPENPLSLAKSIEEVFTNRQLSNHLRKMGPIRVNDFLPEVIMPKFERLFLELCE
jgi:glycosyltransferase involved in cell wall biosynthesis